jgi:hypothetical protein
LVLSSTTFRAASMTASWVTILVTVTFSLSSTVSIVISTAQSSGVASRLPNSGIAWTGRTSVHQSFQSATDPKI